MRRFRKDREHLVRMAGLFLAGVVLFLVARSLLVPRDFYALGHFRTGALADSRARPMAYAGRETCETCHPDIAEERKGSRHAAIGCEACHGPLASHADDPARLKPVRPDAQKICLTCHRQDAAKPTTFKQVNPQEHMGAEPCNACHKPHHPERA
jgi:hypothetical protein